jgi:hypothetical protein
MDAPVVRRDDARALLYIVDHLRPGTVIKRHVEISNKSPVSRKFELYSSAAVIRDNTFTFAPGYTQNELSSWTSIAPARTSLAPHTTIPAEVTIRVPNDATSGERYAVIWAQTSAAPDATHNVGRVNRVGVRIYLSVGTGGEPPSAFTINALTAVRTKQGRPSVVAGVRNTGGRAVDLTGTLYLTDGPGGAMAGPFRANPGTTLPPGRTGTVVVELDPRLPDGPWKARLKLESGKVNREVTARLTFPAPGGTSIAELIHMPGARMWYALGGGVLVLGTAGWLVFARRRRSRQNPVV